MTFANISRLPRALGLKGYLALFGSFAVLAGCGAGTENTNPGAPAPGATGYRLVIDNVNTFDTTDTTMSLNLSGVTSTTLTWSVQALYNGEVACQTSKLNLPLVGSGASGGGQNCHYDMATFSMVCN